MDNAFSRLLKVISLERKQGYRNKAVIGGLDKFASRWEADARAETANAAAVDEIVALLIGYPAVEDTAARERIVEQILRRARDAAPAQAGTAPGGGEERASAPAVPPQPRPIELAPQHAAEPAAERPGPARPTSTPTEPAAEPPTRPETTEPTPTRPMPARNKPDLPPTTRPPAPEPSAAPRSPAPSAKPPRETAPEAPAPVAQPATPPPQSAPAEWIERAERSESAAAAAEALPKPRHPSPDSGLDAPVNRLPGVGPSYAEKLGKLGVFTLRDLLYLLPHRYDDFSQLRTIDKLRWGEEVTVIGTVWSIKSRIIGEDRKMVVAVVGDGTGEMEMTWFSPYVERQLRTGRAYTFAGRIDSYRGRLLIRNPEFEPLDREQLNTGRLAPVYPLTEGITVHWLRAVINRAVESFATQMPDFLPETTRQEAGLMPLADALRQIHFPDNNDLITAAHRRLSFDEFFLLQLGVLAARKRFRGLPARPLAAGDDTLAPFLTALPFGLTGAQSRALADIAADLHQAQPMSRLLQGDVGSGKTAVAAAALWAAVASGYQGAIMAPTEILAEQHARSFGAMFAGLTHPRAGRPVRVALFTGSQRRAEREEALAALAAGNVDIAVGTHALIQGDVIFRELAVAVVDEQHRFGVEQRAALRQKGIQPHVLVMSATPIPRSLALTIYGDLDVSVIDEMPAGRTPIKTKWLTPAQRERAYDFIRRQAADGRQAFIIYPLVEESEHSEAKAAIEEHARLKSAVFPNLRVGLLHGRLKGDDKDAVMRAFGAGELDVLVATSVVEVGIDVPNATVIMIEGAERFGLAQLHQFRGRVGRGQYPSYCILVSDAAEGESIRRLQALEGSTDGFALAQIDLDLRGPGDFFGTRQSGLPTLRTAQLGDLRTLEAARTAAQRLFAADPDLSRPEHRGLAGQVAEFWAGAGDAS
ncbi:MAG: ATP-dependent DNA helicase RecG [Chloroflexi bacterium]|nr:ATP-dependent DNA helicase RecG [Chloroflexota bacterium]